MKSMSKVTLVIVLLLSLFIPQAVSANDDISGHYFEKDIRTLMSKGIVTGYRDGSFGPEDAVTRAEFTTMLVRALNVKASGTPSYSDVKKDAWFYDALMAAGSQGLVGGYTDGSFKPNKEITREEMAVILQRALDSKGIDPREATLNFTDADKIGSAYRTAVKKMVSIGIFTGKESGGKLYFDPKDSTTRAQTAGTLNRTLNVIAGGGSDYEAEEQLKATGKKIVDVDSNDTLNVRSGSGTGHGIVGEVAKGFEVITYHSEGEWVYISYGSIKGFVHSYYLKSESQVSGEQKVVTATALNVRSGPSSSNSKVGVLQGGTTVKQYHTTGDWAFISYGAIRGYVHTNYLADKSLTRRVLALDAGHGAHDPGASANGVIEKEVNLDVAKRTEVYLKNAGVNVVMTRSTDTFISLGGRVDIAENRGADTFVSIHTNAASPAAHGTETFYYTSATQRDVESKQLATFIQKRLIAAWGTYDRGVKTAGFQVIKYNSLPATLVELGFATNSSDAAKLKSSTYRDRAAKAISQGIIDYYNWKESR